MTITMECSTPEELITFGQRMIELGKAINNELAWMAGVETWVESVMDDASMDEEEILARKAGGEYVEAC
jgi:hypothetical protein